MKNLFAEIKSDFKLNSFRSGLILFFYRVTHHIYINYKNPFGKFSAKLISVAWEILKIVININCQISYKAIIGSNIRLPHIGEGVVISSRSIIGNGVTIFHQVTIGVKESLDISNQSIIIGDNCYLSAGAKIISCKLGNNVVVGPNAVVYEDMHDGSKVFVQGIVKHQ